MSEWQPIETAPKDGTPILVFSPYEKRDEPTNIIVARYGTANGEEFWDYCEEMLSNVSGEIDPSPTHWMPLPPPPKGGEK